MWWYISNLEVYLCRGGGELSTRDLQQMVQALPQYSEQIDKISLHVEVSFLLLAANYLFFFHFCWQCVT